MRTQLGIVGLVLTLLAGCDPVQAGGEPSGPGPSTAPPAGRTTAAAPTGHPTAAPASSPAKTYQSDVQAALRTVAQYWQDEFAKHGRDFAAVRTFTPYRGAGGPRCGDEQVPAKNAAYCSGPDYIAYDDEWLREEWSSMGDAFVYYVIGHEYGHAIQQRLGLTAPLTIKSELQADCFAGAYLGGSIADGRLDLDEGDLRELFDAVGSVADQPGVRWFATGAHGSAKQRQIAFFGGYFGTVRSCTTGL
ncbi:neutral zinc metallopeptidase [Dactylosporangium sp. CA-092794]|uniref:neutral zinc metallopeptidase n=1 Tax=Dactylosporangium sp. CA-092794 TaxID=3239929 RepID=UPI003D912C8B